jgi:hypothetical protein
MKWSTRSFAKKASNLCQAIHRHLSVYAGAAVVALVSVLALTQPSEAEIVYTPANVVVSCGHVLAMHHPPVACFGHYNLDLNHDGVTDFTIEVSFVGGIECMSSWGVGELPASGNGAIGGGGYAAALMQGAPIGHSQQFIRSGETMAYYDLYGPGPPCFHTAGGPWGNVTDRYLGLSFRRNGRTHYGWAKLTVSIPSPLYAKLTGYAYETIAGKSIIAGQTKEAADDPTNEDFGPAASLTSPISDKPQPASLGTLALGARSVPLWRRKESAVEGNSKGALL